MKQPQYSPLSVADQALTLFAVNRGYFDDVPVEKALASESAMRQYSRPSTRRSWTASRRRWR